MKDVTFLEVMRNPKLISKMNKKNAQQFVRDTMSKFDLLIEENIRLKLENDSFKTPNYKILKLCWRGLGSAKAISEHPTKSSAERELVRLQQLVSVQPRYIIMEPEDAET